MEVLWSIVITGNGKIEQVVHRNKFGTRLKVALFWILGDVNVIPRWIMVQITNCWLSLTFIGYKYAALSRQSWCFCALGKFHLTRIVIAYVNFRQSNRSDSKGHYWQLVLQPIEWEIFQLARYGMIWHQYPIKVIFTIWVVQSAVICTRASLNNSFTGIQLKNSIILLLQLMTAHADFCMGILAIE